MTLAADLYRLTELARYATEERERLERMFEKAKHEERIANQNRITARLKFIQAEAAAVMREAA